MNLLEDLPDLSSPSSDTPTDTPSSDSSPDSGTILPQTDREGGRDIGNISEEDTSPTSPPPDNASDEAERPEDEIEDERENEGENLQEINQSDPADNVRPLTPEIQQAPLEEELLILAVKVDNLTLSQGILAYQIGATVGEVDQSEVFISLGELMAAVEFPIIVDPTTGTAEGWFFPDERSFRLDFPAQTLLIAGRNYSVDPDHIRQYSDGLYVRQDILEDWFPWQLNLDFSELSLQIDSQQPLPAQERLARENARGRIVSADGDLPDFPRVEPPRQIFSWPFIDLYSQSTIRYDDDNGETAFDQRYSLNAQGMIGPLDGELRVAGDEDDLPDIYLQMGRRQPEGGLLGFVNAREILGGDISTPTIPLIAQNQSGRGVFVSSYPFARGIQGDNRITLRGALPVGWEAELYRNDQLMAFQEDQGTGSYEFVDIPTLIGYNEFQVRLYGPQGQQRDEFERFYIDPFSTEPGKTQFRFAVNQHDTPLFDLNDDDAGSDREEAGEVRATLEVLHILRPGLSFGGSLASLPYEEERINYAQASLNTALWGVLTELHFALSDEEGYAAGISLQRRIGSWSFLAEHTEFSEEFRSERNQDGSIDGLLQRLSLLRINGVLPAPFLGNLPFTVETERKINQEDEEEWEVFARLSARISRMSLNLQTDWDFPEEGDETGDITLRATTLFYPDVRVRGEIEYDVAPELRFARAGITTDWDLEEDWGIRLGLDYLDREDEEALTTFTAGINREFENFDFGLNLDVDSDGDVAMFLALSTSLGYNPRTEEWHAQSRDLANMGAVAPRVFLDRDNDGLFDPEDEPLENVRFSSRSANISQSTDADGMGFLTNIPAWRDIDLSIDQRSLENPFAISGVAGYDIYTHPGRTVYVDFPVVETGEIDGTISRYQDGALVTVPGITMQLRNEAGEIIDQQRSAFDGFYLFSLVPIGNYTIAPDPEQLAQLGYQNIAPRPLHIRSEDSILFGEDFILLAAGGEEPSQPSIASRQETAPQPSSRNPAATDISQAPAQAGGFALQLASFENAAAAQAALTQISERFAGILAPLNLSIQQTNLGDRGIWHRIIAENNGFTRNDMITLCGDLQQNGQDCLVKQR